MKTALVTGAAGAVGRHVCAMLLQHGWWVTAVDTATTPYLGCPPRFWVPGRLDCRTIFASDKREFELVVHCAAVVGGRATIDGDPLATAVNLALDAEMFRWAARTKVRHVVYFSSSAAYPVDLQVTPGHRLAEDDIDLAAPRLPDAVYGWAKLTGELLAERARADGVSVHVLRPFSGYSTTQALDYPFPSFIARAREQQDPFRIWGPGTQVRDWVHINDVIATMTAMIDADHPGPLNVGWGRPTSFIELAVMVSEACGYTPELACDPTAPTGVTWRVCDPTALFELRRPRITLEDGIDLALLATDDRARSGR